MWDIARRIGRLMPVIPVLTASLVRADGVYQVTTRYFTAGFVVCQGRVIRCAPILQRRLAYWCTIAVRVGEGGERDP